MVFHVWCNIVLSDFFIIYGCCVTLSIPFYVVSTMKVKQVNEKFGDIRNKLLKNGYTWCNTVEKVL